MVEHVLLALDRLLVFGVCLPGVVIFPVLLPVAEQIHQSGGSLNGNPPRIYPVVDCVP